MTSRAGRALPRLMGERSVRPGRSSRQSVNSKSNLLDPLFTVFFNPEVLGFSYFLG